MISNWSELSVMQYQEICILNTDDIDKYSSELLSILLDIEMSKIEELDIDSYDSLLFKANFISNPPKSPFKLSLDISGNTFHKLDLSDLTIGEFVDIENLITDIGNNFNVILSILYRLETKKETQLFKRELETYGNWIYHRSNLFDDVPVSYVYNVITEYFKYRSNLFEVYSGLFDSQDDNEDDDEDDGSDQIEDFDDYEVISGDNQTKKESGIAKRNRMKIEANKTAVEKWGWDSMLIRLANGDGLKLEEVSCMSVIQGFNILSIKKELDL